jgi:uncharacterized repeat protein (TIGR03803 family)
MSITRITPLILCGMALGSCARGVNPSPLPAPLVADGVAPAASTYGSLYSFSGFPSGSAPTGLTALHGLLYGTTSGGGAKTFGTVFVRSASGRVRFLYSFRGGADGSEPLGALVARRGALYGTTAFGGKDGDGTVFSIAPSGKERVVYSFKGGSDGATPVLAGMVAVNGALYGTTNAGGDPSCHVASSTGCGTVFEIRSTGKERVLYRFKGKRDGSAPAGSLIEVGGTLYGTTNFGGVANNGTVFKISTSGIESVIYAFKGYPDGAVPYAGVTALNGDFYGTTAFGGAFNYSGTVFRVSPSGIERVLHSFRGFPDGAVPYGSLSVVHGKLYGTTQYGGGATRICAAGALTGCGTVFAIDTSGTQRVLYRFKGPPDGANPWSGLVSSGGQLYGTTLAGGASNQGSIFRISAPQR